MDDLTKIVATGVISLIAGFIIGRTAERRALVTSVVERYLERARSDAELQDDQFLRIGALQSAGAAELRSREFSRVCRRIAARGFRDPSEDLSLFSDRRRHIRSLLRWAARHGIILAGAETLLRIAAEEMDAQRTHQET